MRGIKRLHLTPQSDNFSGAATARWGERLALSLPDSVSFMPSRTSFALLLHFAHPSVVSGAGLHLHLSPGSFVCLNKYCIN